MLTSCSLVVQLIICHVKEKREVIDGKAMSEMEEKKMMQMKMMHTWQNRSI
jgi:hypothetical protein